MLTGVFVNAKRGLADAQIMRWSPALGHDI